MILVLVGPVKNIKNVAVRYSMNVIMDNIKTNNTIVMVIFFLDLIISCKLKLEV